ncbi:STAS/SEC14 domain-containing protein [Ramlibacter henchirensis]|uniref:STAS/SEC14 domain-containing protein n=1 Tax=Ramlibacter henchirensis TaxID=204072 RepID=UPI0014315939|nr:STAS/SEC14 domain-containing protein [Ramlibacter henchirensis]
MAYTCEIELRPDHVRAAIAGSGTVEEFISMVQWLGARSVTWRSSVLLVDLRGVETVYTFTEQLMIGRAVGVNLRHLRRHAAVVRAERITHVGEKAAQHEGSPLRVFADEKEAAAWLFETD